MANRRVTETVLIVEDEADFQSFVSRVLGLEGYHVIQAQDGDECLRLMKEIHIALVLLDLMISGRDGWDVLESDEV